MPASEVPPYRPSSGEQANKGTSMGAKVVIGTRVTRWSDCKEMIRTVSSLASLQTLLIKDFPEYVDGAFVANFSSFVTMLVVTKIENRS